MKVYEIKKKEKAPNVFGISLVENPAMESNYVALSKEEKLKQKHIQFKEYDKEKRLLLGLVLEPDKLIYRFNEQTKEEYYITVSEETILELQQDYIKQSNQNYSTLEHDGRELDGITFTEHWIVEDSKIDKSALHNFEFKKGSWVTVAKIENDTLWNDYIKTGEVMGFSIDAMVHLEEVNLNKQEMSENKNVIAQFAKDFIDAIKTEFGSKKEETKEVEEIKTELSETEVKEVEEVVEVETKSEENETFDMDAFKQAMTEIGVEFSTVVKDALKPVQDANVELQKEVEALKVELADQPTSKPIVSKPTNVDFSKMSEWDKRQYYKQNG